MNGIFSSLIYKFFNSCLISLMIVIPCYSAFLTKCINYISDINFISLVLTFGYVVFLLLVLKIINNKKEINQLEKAKKQQQKAKTEEIKVFNKWYKINIKRYNKQQRFDNYNKKFKNTIWGFARFIWKINAFETDNVIGEELENLDVIGENNLDKNNTVKRKRYKIIISSYYFL